MIADVSVVIPTFRRPRQLREAIASALAQRGAEVEVIVVDDSPEGSAEPVALAAGHPRVVYLRNPSPSGGIPSAVRNLGWPLASGAFVHFLDDDDVVPDGHYAYALAAFAARPDVGLVFGRVEPFGEGPVDQLERERRYFVDRARKAAISGRFGARAAFCARMLFDDALLVCSASMIRREGLARLGGFDPAIRLMEDADYHLRAMRELGALFLHRTTVRYRIGYPSLMHSPDPSDAQRAEELQGRRQMQTKYKRDRGAIEFYALALFARTALKQV
jgi:glycosyltransferase involved in cell wall biosynthesis